MMSPFSRGSPSSSKANRAKKLLAHAAGADRETGICLALTVPERLDRGAVDMEYVNHGRLLSVAGWPVEHLSALIAHKAWDFSSVCICMVIHANLPKIAMNLEMVQREPLRARKTPSDARTAVQSLLSMYLQRPVANVQHYGLAVACPSIVTRWSAPGTPRKRRNIRFRIKRRLTE
ncbi:hypothetical protein BC363_28100 [Ensifer sp. LC384]|nr:hypothetical protein BC363_28100 [Ensifer sp. LC384]